VRAAVISADSIGYARVVAGVGRDFTEDVRRRVEARAGIPGSHVMLASTHAHSTPETLAFTPIYELPGVSAWLDALMDQLADCVAKAAGALRPAELRVGHGTVTEVSWNRRARRADGKGVFRPAVAGDDKAAGTIDPDVGVALLGYDDGSRDALMNFACHPVCVQVQPLFSADYPGVARAMVEQVALDGGRCLFLQGADGDINPVTSTTNFAEMTRLGRIVGLEAAKVAERLRAPDSLPEPWRVPVAQGPLKIARRKFPVGGNALPRSEPHERALAEAQRAYERAKSDQEKSAAATRIKIEYATVTRLRRGPGPFEAEAQTLRLGDLALVGVPGELFVDYGLEIKRRSPFKHTFIVAYANDYLGYLATPQAWQQGGYEVGLGPWCLVSAEGAAEIVREATETLRDLS